VDESFGRYRLLGELGKGGMGQVFRAYDTATNREVALKVLAAHVAQDRHFEQRFRREAQVAARLNDPHVIPIHGYGEIDGRLYVDMPLISGQDLGSVLEESGAMNPARAVAIIGQVAEALEAAHEFQLVHRDVKPSNILLAKRDFVYLIDFGIAKELDATRITKTGMAVGTFAYMSPERIETGVADGSSDLYSLACVLYECLTGRLPFPGDSIHQQIAGHLSKPAPRPSVVAASVPPAFDQVIARGMAKDPGQRYPTVMAFADAARAALDGRPPEAPAEAAPTQWATTQQAPEYAPPGSLRPANVVASAPLPTLESPTFIVPGVLIMLFAGLGAVLPFLFFEFWVFDLLVERLLFLALWLVLAAAFGLVARTSRAAAAPAAAVTAWVTCAAAVVAAVAFAAPYVFGPTPDVVGLLPELTFWVLIAFGVAAHRPFGWWWSVPATAAGLLGATGYTFSPPYSVFVFSHFVLDYIAFVIFAVMLIPVFILGIAMARTRRDAPSATS
jgi:predicted Ser/Thr protein kinase